MATLIKNTRSNQCFFLEASNINTWLCIFFSLGWDFIDIFIKPLHQLIECLKKKKRFPLVRQGPNNSNDAGEKRLRPIAHGHKCVCVRVFAFSPQWQSWAVSSGFNHERFYNGSLIPSSRTARADKINPALLRIETINHLFSLNSTESLWQVRKTRVLCIKCYFSYSFLFSLPSFHSPSLRHVLVYIISLPHADKCLNLLTGWHSRRVFKSPQTPRRVFSIFAWRLIKLWLRSVSEPADECKCIHAFAVFVSSFFFIFQIG